MTATLFGSGNSRGIRPRKPVIEQCGFDREAGMEVHRHNDSTLHSLATKSGEKCGLEE